MVKKKNVSVIFVEKLMWFLLIDEMGVFLVYGVLIIIGIVVSIKLDVIIEIMFDYGDSVV